jgi:type III restriction enzyme
LISLVGPDGEDRMLILEVKGDEDNRDRAKFTFARNWVESVNSDGRYGRWESRW